MPGAGDEVQRVVSADGVQGIVKSLRFAGWNGGVVGPLNRDEGRDALADIGDRADLFGEGVAIRRAGRQPLDGE